MNEWSIPEKIYLTGDWRSINPSYVKFENKNKHFIKFFFSFYFHVFRNESEILPFPNQLVEFRLSEDFNPGKDTDDTASNVSLEDLVLNKDRDRHASTYWLPRYCAFVIKIAHAFCVMRSNVTFFSKWYIYSYVHMFGATII